MRPVATDATGRSTALRVTMAVGGIWFVGGLIVFVMALSRHRRNHPDRVDAVLPLTALGLGSFALVWAVVAVVLGQSNPFILILLIVVSAAAGVLGHDWWLTQAVGKQDEEIIAEFPVIAEMLALSVTAGESPMGAIDRVTKLAHGPLVGQLGGVLAETRAGTPFLTALTHLRDRTRLEPLARFLDGMAVAIERGTPLADVLRAQAADVRALSKRQLLESGGRKEIAMMVPVNMHS